jgi:O-antigen ligase/Tfp pilus assembly protein PilF
MNRKTIVFWLRAVTFLGIYAGLLMPLVFVPVVIFPFVFSKLIFLQVLIGLTFPAYLALAWMEPSVRPRRHVLLGAIAFYFLTIGLSVIFGVDPMRSWWGNQERMNGLFTLLHFLAWLLMTTGLVKTWAQWRRLLNFELALSVIMACVSILQIPFPNLLLFPVSARIGGLLDNPIYMAAYQIFNIFFALWLLAKSPSKTTKGIYACVILFQLIAFFLAQTRGALVGLAAGVLVVGVIVGLTQKDRRVKRGVIGAVAAVFVAYGILFALRNTETIKHSPFERITSGFNVIPEPRLIAWRIAWEGFKERPLTGWGFDAYHILFNLKYNPESLRYSQYETWFDRSHNTIMDVLSMTGGIGFIGFAGLYLALFWSLYRAYRDERLDSISFALLTGLPVAYFVQNIFVFDHPAAFTMSYLLFALVIGVSSHGFHLPGAEPKEEGVVVHGKPRNFPLTSFVIVQLIALGVVWRYSVLPFQASRLMIQANSAFQLRPARYDIALELFKMANAIPTPYLDEQAYLMAKNLTELAQDSALKTSPKRDELVGMVKRVAGEELLRHPRSTNMLFLIGRFYQEMSVLYPADAQTANDLYQRALQTSPRRQQLFFALADFNYRQNKPEEAMKYERLAVEQDEELGQAHLAYGISLLFRKKDEVNGPKQILLSQTVKFPYELTMRELPAVVEATFLVKDKAVAKLLIDRYSTLGTTADYVKFYADFAHRLDVAGYQDLTQDLYRALPVEIVEQVRRQAGAIVSDTGPTIETANIETVPVAATATRKK